MKKRSFFVIFLLGHVLSFAQPQELLKAVFIGEEPVLEIIQASQEEKTAQPPLLFIHGYRMGAWIFEDHYLPFFYEKGYDVFALNLRGHGWSEEAEKIESHTFENYYEDVQRAVAYIVEQTDQEPLLIGYSFGGILVQRYIEQYQPEAAVILSMGEVETGLPHYINWSQKHFPQKTEHFFQNRNCNKLFQDPAMLKQIFFLEGEKPEGINKYLTRLATQPGSNQLFSKLLEFDLPPIGGNTQVLLMSGDQDPMAPLFALVRAQKLLDAKLVIIEDTGHGLPIGKNWKKGARAIHQFVRQLSENSKENVSLMGIKAKE